MKKSVKTRIFLSFLTSTFLLTSAEAKSINFYEQPKADSKLVGTLDSDAGVITIYTPKDGDWIKVADPRNGNVGWIKSSDLSGSSTTSFNIISTGNGPKGYQVIQFGNSKPFTAEQYTQAMKQFEMQQEAIQKNMQQMMNNMFKDLPQQWMSYPMMVPVIVVPEKSVKPAPVEKENKK
jgi:hypothetical protein